MDMKRLGVAIKSARKHRGYSLKSLGDAVGVHYTQISRMERGAGALLSKNVRKVCKYLQVPVPSASGEFECEDLVRKVQDLVQAWPQSEKLIRAVVESLEAALDSSKVAQYQC